MSIAEALERWELDVTTPAYQMCLYPHNLHVMGSGTPAQNALLLRAAMQNMWLYGRALGRWSWLAGENPYTVKQEEDFNALRAFSPAKPGVGFLSKMSETHQIKGWGILAGWNQCNWSNCEGFAVALKVFAERILGIDGIEKASITDPYLTAPVLDGTIDKRYGPTVKTDRKSADMTGIYYYATHAFLRYGGLYYDVTCAQVFNQSALDVRANQASEAKFCDLVPVKNPPTKTGPDGTRRRMFEVANPDAVIAAQLGLVQGRKAWLIELAERPASWSDWLLTEAESAANATKLD